MADVGGEFEVLKEENATEIQFEPSMVAAGNEENTKVEHKEAGIVEFRNKF